MNNLFSYSIEANISLLILVSLFVLAFRQLSFFRWNRLLLIALVSFCTLVPLLKFKTDYVKLIDSKTNSNQEIQSPEQLGYSNAPFLIEPEEQLNLWDRIELKKILAYAYLLIAIFFLIRLVYRSLKLVCCLKKMDFQEHQGIKVIPPFNRFNNCSIFHYIVMDKSALESPEGKLIFAHEAQHILKGHAWDKLYIELMCCIFWINPAIYWVRKELYRLHEFQVDIAVAKCYGKTDYASFLLNMTQQNQQLDYMQSRILKNQNELVERIDRLMRNLSPRTKGYQYLLFVPCIFVLIVSFSFIDPPKEKISTTSAVKNSAKTIVLDPGHGGKDSGATNSKGLKEKDLTLQACKMIQNELEKEGFQVVLTHSKDEFMMLKDRTAFTGDALISIHFDIDPSNAKQPIGLRYPKAVELPKIQDQSRELAFRLTQNLKNQGLSTQKPVESHNHAILRGAKIPALIVSLGNMNTFSNTLDPQFISAFTQALKTSLSE
ncbi:N-acetylmuramoyl-L-alanine amidase [Sphingobacterium sp. BIGb0165]|uniref:N-acetylmuramoyl-L-alanine amidase n=1 Tax=Sphingobacterium sp. BIGb0165 TaxID=2940615 RepID=UPI00216A4A0B|nr:N-acetylmuramoyl-L-alanine amidase [Sphingobacterium sp. BIGb0165]MCS4227199.1 N-acetylmuramoyl-L-alanine amidase [Sphingobacterium sp. BIGb0165]